MPITWRNLTLGDDILWTELAARRDLYEILDVSPQISPSALKRAYRSLIAKYHPDRHPAERRQWAEERAKNINRAYTVLSNPQQRAAYDRRRTGEGHVG